MPTISSLQLPPPKHWQDFETLCCDLWREVWNDPNAQKNGRQGQAQHGVDVFGRSRDRLVGVQCKGKDNYTNQKITEEELRDEVTKARSFRPALAEFTVATTAPRDVAIQTLARELSEQHRTCGLFSVHVWSWDDIVESLGGFLIVAAKHYPQFVFRYDPDFALIGEQRALYLALGDQHADLAALYLGVVIVLRHGDNPERIPQAAFSIRELLVKLPNHLDVPMPAHRERLGDRIDVVKKCWDSAAKHSTSRQNGTWKGTIDGNLERLLTKLEDLFRWRDEHHPHRRDEVAALLRRLDPAGGKLPTQLESVNYKEWSDLSDFFNDVLHHNRVVTLDEFQAKLTAVERLLLDRLRPRTFADWQTIDDIIREGESHD
jgi:hypothetical protein